MIERQGITLVGIAVANLENDDAVQLALPFERSRGGALDAALDERARAVRVGRGHARGAARPRPGLVGAAAARLMRGKPSRR